MKCKSCNTIIASNMKFCDICGAKLYEEKKCSCGKICEGFFNYCPYCGKSFETGKTFEQSSLKIEMKKSFELGEKDLIAYFDENRIYFSDDE